MRIREGLGEDEDEVGGVRITYLLRSRAAASSTVSHIRDVQRVQDTVHDERIHSDHEADQ